MPAIGTETIAESDVEKLVTLAAPLRMCPVGLAPSREAVLCREAPVRRRCERTVEASAVPPTEKSSRLAEGPKSRKIGRSFGWIFALMESSTIVKLPCKVLEIKAVTPGDFGDFIRRRAKALAIQGGKLIIGFYESELFGSLAIHIFPSHAG